MGDNLNRSSTNLNERDTENEFKRESQTDMMLFYEEISIMKTEVKEEVFDFENPVGEEYDPSVKSNFEEEDSEVVNGTEQSLNENHVSGNSQLREEDLQEEQKLSTKHLHLIHNKAERRNYFKRHILKKQDGESKKYKCADCKYATLKKKNPEQHIRIHTNDRPYKCTYKNCECAAGQEESCKCICGFAAAQKINLKVHILTKHSEEPKKYKCAECNYATHIKTALTQHIRIHTNNKPHKCSMCGYAAAQKANLKKHILAKHSAEPKQYKCADCNYAAHRKYVLQHHIRTHTNDKPFKCTYKNCECTVGQEESCKCSMCGYAAAQKAALKSHILTKHNTEPKKYKCADCNYATHRKFMLEQHIRVHTNDRPFKCTYKNCECTAGQKESCKCNVCGFAAAQKGQLKVHILMKHSAEPKKY